MRCCPRIKETIKIPVQEPKKQSEDHGTRTHNLVFIRKNRRDTRYHCAKPPIQRISNLIAKYTQFISWQSILENGSSSACSVTLCFVPYTNNVYLDIRNYVLNCYMVILGLKKPTDVIVSL